MLRAIGAVLCAALVLPQVAFGEKSKPAAAPAPVAVIQANFGPELTALQAGYVEWLRLQVSAAGVRTKGGLTVRRALAKRSANVRPRTRELATLAAGLGSERVLLVDAKLENGSVVGVLRVHEAPTGRL